jgi:hypothetical protein
MRRKVVGRILAASLGQFCASALASVLFRPRRAPAFGFRPTAIPETISAKTRNYKDASTTSFMFLGDMLLATQRVGCT